MHNVADQQRDYLFQNESGQATYQGEMNTGIIINSTGMIDSLINPDEVTQIIGNEQTGQIDTGTMSTGNLDCITPWEEKIKNKDFVLAYQQRADVNTICDIEKRVCTEGVLWGTFSWASCKEGVIYEYTKAPVVSYNQKVLNEYIQPTTPINVWAEFDTQGKINTTEKPIDIRGTTNSPVTTQPAIKQSPLPNKASCKTPRGQTIKHGQFVKAYKAPRGFIDLPCNVELRACVNWSLKGSLTNAKCNYTNTTYTDYLTGSSTMNTGFFFFEWIKSILN